MLKAIVIGNLGRDAKTSTAASGAPMVSFSVASNFRKRNPNGEWVDAVEWLNVTYLGTRATSIAGYLRKGTKVYVDGRLEARPGFDHNQQFSANLSILADMVQIVSSRQDNQNGQPWQAPRPSGPNMPGGAGYGDQPRPPVEGTASGTVPEMPDWQQSDLDIPFS